MVKENLPRNYVSELPKNRKTTKQVFLICNWFNKSKLEEIPFKENWNDQMRSLVMIVEKGIEEVYRQFSPKAP